MRILSGLLVALASNSVTSVNGISPSASIGALGTVKGDTPDKNDKNDKIESLKKKFAIGTSGLNDDVSNSISSFASAVKSAKIASGIKKDTIEKNLLKSLAQQEVKGERVEKTEKKAIIEKKRDNIGHNKSTKIKVVTSKITTKTTKSVPKVSKVSKKDSDEESDDESDKALEKNDQSSAIKKQILMGVTYMLASRFMMKINFKDAKAIQMCRVVFACYLIASQLLFYIIKMKIEEKDDNTIMEPVAAFSMKSLQEKIPMLNNLGENFVKICSTV